MASNIKNASNCKVPNFVQIKIPFRVALNGCKISLKDLGTGRFGQFVPIIINNQNKKITNAILLGQEHFSRDFIHDCTGYFNRIKFGTAQTGRIFEVLRPL